MSNQIQTLLNEALNYAKMGFSIIPVGRDKRPLIDWKEFQTRKATEEEIKEWFINFPDANIAMITGEISGLFVIDIEAGGSPDGLLPTVISKTGGGGWHYFYKYPNRKIKNAVRIADKVDIRGDGGYVVLPPSLHTSGNQYEWAVPFDMADPVEIPEDSMWFSLLNEQGKKVEISKGVKDWEETFSATNPEGTRNNQAAKIAGIILNKTKEDSWERIGWPALRDWNQSNNNPPLKENELRTVWESIKNTKINKSETQKEIRPIHISELMKKEFNDPEWIVEGLIPGGGITAISGAPASYKTWIMLHLTLNVPDEKLLFNKFKTSKKGILIVDEENGERMFNQRFKKLGYSDNLNIHILSLETFKLNSTTVNKLISVCKEKEIELIIFDSLVRIHEGDENSATDMSAVAGFLKQLNKAGITVIFTHHNRKTSALRSNPSQDMRGSSDILASVDCHIAIERKEKLITIRQTKLRQTEEMKPFQLNVIGDEDKIEFEFAGELNEEKGVKDEFKEGIKNILLEENKPMYKKEIFNQLRENGFTGGWSTFKKAADELAEEGVLYQQRGEGNKVYCSLIPPEELVEDFGSVSEQNTLNNNLLNN